MSDLIQRVALSRGNGNRHDGYAVSMVFTSLSKQAQARLDQLAFP